ncbi:hypothetical protein KFE98_05050 [bacterium SCSIO 12741]|nr:hypothetical protein KFE98_05050 [bacterium SCSIO 12741]
MSNFKDFYVARKGYLESGNQLVAHEKKVSKLDQDFALSSRDLMESVCGSEIGLAILEVNAPTSGEQVSSLGGRAIGLIRLIDPGKMKEAFAPLMLTDDEGEVDVKEYRETSIYTLKPNGLLEVYLGNTFRVLESQYLMELDGFAILGNKLSTMREVINAFKGNKTLDGDENFENFSDNLSSTANLTAYVNIARSPYLIHHFLAPKNRSWVDDNLELLRKFEGVCLQVSHDQGNMYYNNLFLKHNPIYKKVTASLWEIPLDTTVSSQPYLFTNHYTKAREVFIQDDNNRVYLISNTGRILWSRDLEGPMVGGIFEVDKYRNDKYQILFGTAHKIYLIDRNGKDVDGFPIRLSEKASAPVMVFDYDNNQKYRIMAPLKDGNVVCYDIQGKPVKGWKYKKGDPVGRRMTHVVVNKKDYIIAWQENGGVRVVNRRGEDRLKLKNELQVNERSPLRVLPGKDLKSTFVVATDSSGNLLQLSLQDKLETVQFKHFDARHYFDLIDVNQDGETEYLFLNGEGLEVYDAEGKSVLLYPLEKAQKMRPGIFTGQEGAYITLVQDSLAEVHLVDRFGSPMEGSPFYGQTRARVTDLNLDGRLELVTCSYDGMVYCYVLN